MTDTVPIVSVVAPMFSMVNVRSRVVPSATWPKSVLSASEGVVSPSMIMTPLPLTTISCVAETTVTVKLALVDNAPSETVKTTV